MITLLWSHGAPQPSFIDGGCGSSVVKVRQRLFCSKVGIWGASGVHQGKRHQPESIITLSPTKQRDRQINIKLFAPFASCHQAHFTEILMRDMAKVDFPADRIFSQTQWPLRGFSTKPFGSVALKPYSLFTVWPEMSLAYIHLAERMSNTCLQLFFQNDCQVSGRPKGEVLQMLTDKHTGMQKMIFVEDKLSTLEKMLKQPHKEKMHEKCKSIVHSGTCSEKEIALCTKHLGTLLPCLDICALLCLAAEERSKVEGRVKHCYLPLAANVPRGFESCREPR
eukprot:1158722-Pelagomonas_calceolata.AAC.2